MTNIKLRYMDTRKLAERETFLAQIVMTAVEGIAHWATILECMWRFPECGGNPELAPHGGGNAHARIWERDSPLSVSFYITPQRVAGGLKLIRSGAVPDLAPEFCDTMAVAYAQNDATLVDAHAADVIVQVALFGEVRYPTVATARRTVKSLHQEC